MEDFWKFLGKYQRLQKANKIKTISILRSNKKDSNHCSQKFGLPLTYDKKHCVSFCLNIGSAEYLQSRLPPCELDEMKFRLSQKRIEELKVVILLYLNFLQRQRFDKLKKLRESQKKLPISEFKGHILDTVKENSIIIVAGDTGCGKSTQVPQYLLNAGYRHVGCTQPRRIACISLCKRVSFETLNEYGSEIGYQIRFDRQKTDHTRVVFLTEGLLLKQVSSDPHLSYYDVIILDEIHERHLQTDLLLGILKCLLMQRNDIKIILMSATINIELFNQYFMGKAPVIQVPGRLYPIELKYFPSSIQEKGLKSEKIDPAPYIRILQMIDTKYPINERGDVLIFVSGFSEITSISDAARMYAQQSNKWIILPLHSTLSIVDQERVFDIPPDGKRKCIVSTNIAETSVTIDGIRFVIDSGKVKEMSYESVSKLQKLKEFWVSQASAEQRKGRAGRTGPGVCYRLYSEEEYIKFIPYSTPEIQRVPLDSLTLQMISMGLPDIKLFPFIDPPANINLNVSIKYLKQQSALTKEMKLTTLGEILAQLPMDITLGKMLIMGSLFTQAGPVLSLAAALSVQSPYTNRAFRDLECSNLNEIFESSHGDPFTLLAAYREWLNLKIDNREYSRRWCQKRGLEEQRFYEITKLRQQFTLLISQSGLKNLPEHVSGTAAERSKRFGELSHLKNMKSTIHKQGPRKVKVLKVDHEGYINSDDENDSTLELKNIDFKIRYDSKTLQLLHDESYIHSFKDVILLKIIICSGLYPNIAIADEHNNYKQGADQIFHTKNKPFAILHPNSTLTRNLEVLQLNNSEIIELPNFSPRFPCSSRHQLLVFVSLLETNKAYIVNSLRVPAVQTLLLFAHEIDTNSDISLFVFDGFIEIKFTQCAAAQNLLFQAMLLRSQWDKLLEYRMKASKPSIECKEDLVTKALRLEKDLTAGLLDFYMIEPLYSMKRLLPADHKILYKGLGPEVPTVSSSPFLNMDEQDSISEDKQCTSVGILPNVVKGGFLLNACLTYDCILDFKNNITSISSYDSICVYCDREIHMNTLERLHHMRKCVNSSNILQMEMTMEGKEANQSCKIYYCPICKKKLTLTIKETLKHKKSHTLI